MATFFFFFLHFCFRKVLLSDYNILKTIIVLIKRRETVQLVGLAFFKPFFFWGSIKPPKHANRTVRSKHPSSFKLPLCPTCAFSMWRLLKKKICLCMWPRWLCSKCTLYWRRAFEIKRFTRSNAAVCAIIIFPVSTVGLEVFFKKCCFQFLQISQSSSQNTRICHFHLKTWAWKFL